MPANVSETQRMRAAGQHWLSTPWLLFQSLLWKTAQRDTLLEPREQGRGTLL